MGPYSSRPIERVAKVRIDSEVRRWLASQPTQSVSQGDDLKVSVEVNLGAEGGMSVRVWLSRVTSADGRHPAVEMEIRHNGAWWPYPEPRIVPEIFTAALREAGYTGGGL